jgi:hypothetical protein
VDCVGISYQNSRRAVAVHMLRTRPAMYETCPSLWGAVDVGYQRDDVGVCGGLVVVDVDDRKAYRHMALHSLCDSWILLASNHRPGVGGNRRAEVHTLQ